MNQPSSHFPSQLIFGVLYLVVLMNSLHAREDGAAPSVAMAAAPAVPVGVSPAVPVDAPTALPVNAPIPPTTQPQRYTLTDYLAAVMSRNPGILSAELDSQSIDYARHAAQAAYFPKLILNGSTGYQRGETISPFVRIGSHDEDKVNGFYDVGGATLTIPVFSEGTFLGINTPPKKAIALAEEKQADARVVLAKDEIRFRAMVVYLQAVAASKQADILQPKLAALEREVQMLQIKRRYNLVSDAQIRASESQLAEVSALSQQAQWLTASALIQVTQLLGLDDPRQVQIEATYPQLCRIPDYQQILTSTLLNHPALQNQEAAIDQAKAQHKLDQSAFYPTVTSRNSYEYGDNYDPPGTDRWLAALDISVPLFDGGVNYYNARSSEKKFESESQQLYQVKLDIESEVQAAYTALENGNATYATSLVALNQQYVQYRRSQIMSRMGALPMNDFLNSQIAYSDAAALAETNHFQLLLAYAGLEKVTSGAWKWPLVIPDNG